MIIAGGYTLPECNETLTSEHMKPEDMLPHNNCNMSVSINWNIGHLSIPAHTHTKNYISLSKKGIQLYSLLLPSSEFKYHCT